MTKSRSKSSQRWLNRQHADIFTSQAKKEGFRSRAAYKLMEIQQKDKIFQKGMTIVDLGAAPGGWTQVAAHEAGESSRIVAIDILTMDSLSGVDIIQGDFRETEVVEKLKGHLAEKPVDLVLSDMAPNMSGMKSVDQSRSMYLAELALDFCFETLSPGGKFLVKVFQGEGFEAFLTTLKESFEKVIIRKPKASRSESRELYLLAKGYLPNAHARLHA